MQKILPIKFKILFFRSRQSLDRQRSRHQEIRTGSGCEEEVQVSLQIYFQLFSFISFFISFRFLENHRKYSLQMRGNGRKWRSSRDELPSDSEIIRCPTQVYHMSYHNCKTPTVHPFFLLSFLHRSCPTQRFVPCL